MGKQWKQWQTLFWGVPKNGDWSHEIKICVLLGRKAMTNLNSILKSRDITLLTNVHLVKAMVLPVVMYGCESWTVKKAEHWRMAGWHHRLDGRESEWTLGVGDGQGGLTCCSSWGLKESDTTEWLNWTELNWRNECYIDKKRFKAGKWEWKSKGGWEKAVCEMWGELREMGDLKPSEDSTSKRRECSVWSGAAEME